MVLMTTMTAGVVALLLYVVYCLDDWLGILAFQYQYLAFCVLIAGTVATAWLAKSKTSSVVAGLTVIAVFLSPYVLGEPSSRILRKILIEVRAGTPGNEVEDRVIHAYQESGYVMPRITRSDRRIHVSLLTQAPGDCTAAIFHLANGVVVSDEFSAD